MENQNNNKIKSITLGKDDAIEFFDPKEIRKQRRLKKNTPTKRHSRKKAKTKTHQKKNLIKIAIALVFGLIFFFSIKRTVEKKEPETAQETQRNTRRNTQIKQGNTALRQNYYPASNTQKTEQKPSATIGIKQPENK